MTRTFSMILAICSIACVQTLLSLAKESLSHCSRKVKSARRLFALLYLLLKHFVSDATHFFHYRFHKSRNATFQNSKIKHVYMLPIFMTSSFECYCSPGNLRFTLKKVLTISCWFRIKKDHHGDWPKRPPTVYFQMDPMFTKWPGQTRQTSSAYVELNLTRLLVLVFKLLIAQPSSLFSLLCYPYCGFELCAAAVSFVLEYQCRWEFHWPLRWRHKWTCDRNVFLAMISNSLSLLAYCCIRILIHILSCTSFLSIINSHFFHILLFFIFVFVSYPAVLFSNHFLFSSSLFLSSRFSFLCYPLALECIVSHGLLSWIHNVGHILSVINSSTFS